MEAGGLMLNCLLQHALRSLCASSDSSTPSKWVYAVFWRILPRNYPPPKWDHADAFLDRAKGNKRNWILVWEDGFCDFCECERAASGCEKRRFGAEIFFKMTHEVYNFGEGLVGKVASDNSHRWVFRDSTTENDPTLISSWNAAIDPQPRAWEAQFSSGIETIAIISVREGAIQLGSFDKVVEDLNLVFNIQRKFSYLQSIPGIYTIQRPYLTVQNPYFLDHSSSQRLMQTNGSYDNHCMIRSKRQNYDQTDDDLPTKSTYLGHNSPHYRNGNGALPFWPIPPLLPSIPSNLGALYSKIPSASVPYYGSERIDYESGLFKSETGQNLKGGDCVKTFDGIPAVDIKLEMQGVQEEGVEEEKSRPFKQTVRLEDGSMSLGFETHNNRLESVASPD